MSRNLSILPSLLRKFLMATKCRVEMNAASKVKKGWLYTVRFGMLNFYAVQINDDKFKSKKVKRHSCLR